MTTITGRELRYFLTLTVHAAPRALTVDDLVAAVRAVGLQLDGRPSKVISDSLRWEIRRQRVVRVGRSLYAPGVLPRSTRSFMRLHLREALARERAGNDSSSV